MRWIQNEKIFVNIERGIKANIFFLTSRVRFRSYLFQRGKKQRAGTSSHVSEKLSLSILADFRESKNQLFKLTRQ